MKQEYRECVTAMVKASFLVPGLCSVLVVPVVVAVALLSFVVIGSFSGST